MANSGSPGQQYGVVPFGISRHDAVLNAVLDHLDEVTGAIRSAVQIPLFGGKNCLRQ